MLIFNDLFRLTKLFVQKGVSPLYLIELPHLCDAGDIGFIAAMALLVAILLALGRLSTDNEIIAMKAHGIAFHQLMLPLLAVATALSLVDLVLIDYALPRANLAYASLQRDIRRHKPAFVLEAATVMKELENEGKLWMYESMDTESGRMQTSKSGIISGADARDSAMHRKPVSALKAVERCSRSTMDALMNPQ